MVNVGIRMSNIGEFLRVFVVDVEKEEIKMIDMPNTLRDMKKLTKASCIEIGDIEVQGQAFKAVFGSKVKTNQHISCADVDGKVVYRGNVIVVAFETDAYGNETLSSLTDDDINLLLANTGMMFIENGDSPYNAYVLCNVIDKDKKEEGKA